MGGWSLWASGFEVGKEKESRKEAKAVEEKQENLVPLSQGEEHVSRRVVNDWCDHFLEESKQDGRVREPYWICLFPTEGLAHVFWAVVGQTWVGVGLEACEQW